MAAKRRNTHSIGTPIPFADYQRVFRVIKSVLDSVDAKTDRACLFFGCAGAYILETVYRRPARPIVGAALYRVDDADGFTIVFGRVAGAEVVSDSSGFHCWIESGDWIIDFMAPLFSEVGGASGRTQRIPRRMFQRPVSAMAMSPDGLRRAGDFLLRPDPMLTKSLLEGFVSRPASGDLIDVCRHWFAPCPHPIQPTIQMGSDDGTVRSIGLSALELDGTW